MEFSKDEIGAKKMEQLKQRENETDNKRREGKLLSLQKNVTEVEKRAWKNNIRLRVAELPSVRAVRDEAFFSCTSLHTVRFPEVQVVGKRAFAGCSKLKNVEFPEQLKKMGLAAFQDNKRLEMQYSRKTVFSRF